jgi:lipopolysaccharide biosynthesis glycosyltransferase
VADSKNLLVTLADKNYILQARQLFSGVYWNAGWAGDYMLLAHEVDEEELKWFRDKGILIKKCAPLFKGSLGEREYSTNVLDKFYLFTEEFKKWEHIVFLDGDIIVRASLDALTKTKSLASPKTCKDYFKYYFTNGENNELSLLKKEYNLNRPAFNSGVLSFHTQIIKEDTFDKLIAVFKKFASLSNGDDSIMNLFFYEQWVKVPLVFNVLVHNFGLKKYKAIILHFNKPAKLSEQNLRPWDKGNRYYEEWKTNLERAELIDLNKIQKGKKWNLIEIEYYSFLLNCWIYANIVWRNIKLFFCNTFKYQVLYKLKDFFIYVKNTPEMLIGKIGMVLKKYFPHLYDKIKKVIGGK